MLRTLQCTHRRVIITNFDGGSDSVLDLAGNNCYFSSTPFSISPKLILQYVPKNFSHRSMIRNSVNCSYRQKTCVFYTKSKKTIFLRLKPSHVLQKKPEIDTPETFTVQTQLL